MVLTTVTACFMAYSSDYDVQTINTSDTFSPLDQSYEWMLLEHKIVDKVYDTYLFFIRHNMAYIAYICSKDADGQPVGWQILEYPIAVRLFPMLEEHKADYAEFISS